MQRQKGLRTAHFGDTVLPVREKIAKKLPIWRFFSNFGDFFGDFGDFFSVLATLCRRSKPRAILFAFAWSLVITH